MTVSKELFDVRPKTKSKLPENPDETSLGRFPKWLHRKIPDGKTLFETNEILRKNKLYTVCEEAKCPNRSECYSNHTATFLALGNECTRACGFCDIDFAKQPKEPEKEEPARIAQTVKDLKLKHVVITMVARDDLPDKGAEHIAKIISTLRAQCPGTTIEVLTSDFSGDFEAIDQVLEAKPEIFNHNIETVRSLSPRVRHKATYERTLAVLNYVKSKKKVSYVKSGIMVGLGEEDEEVFETIRDLHDAGCDIITIGHYLQANKNKLRVKNFITPEQFKRYEIYGQEIGIKQMYSGPFVRSSYNAKAVFEAM